jgi:subtilisin family serine protease
LPFAIEYLGTSYSTIYVSTNHYLTFGGGSTNYLNLGPSNPNFPKIMWSCADNSVQNILYGVEGTAPNRTYRVRVNGTASTTGIYGSPNMVHEYVFYEAIPNQIDLQLGVNARKLVGGGFSTNQLNAWGFIASQRIPVRVAAMDSDIEDAIDEGILYVGAAGNGQWKHDVPGGLDWDNTFEMANRYPGSVSQPYYYMRGTSPTANDTTANGGYDIPNICVGSVDTIQIDQKVRYSDCGPGVDIWAPGTYIMSALPFGVIDPRSASFSIGKFSGTSMASPQVAGVLAGALEVYPGMKQEEAKAYILAYAKANQLTASTGGPTDDQDLQGAPNLFLYYKKEREISGNVSPKINYQIRPSSGAVYPRSRIRKYG